MPFKSTESASNNPTAEENLRRRLEELEAEVEDLRRWTQLDFFIVVAALVVLTIMVLRLALIG
jgi:hypothetical protein